MRAQGAQRAVVSPDTSPGTRASHQGQRRRPWALRVEQQSRKGDRELDVILLSTVSKCTQAVPAEDMLGPADRERAGLLERRANADAPETASNAKPLRASIHQEPGAAPQKQE